MCVCENKDLRDDVEQYMSLKVMICVLVQFE